MSKYKFVFIDELEVISNELVLLSDLMPKAVEEKYDHEEDELSQFINEFSQTK